MSCPKCVHDNPPSSKFCLECGAKLASGCPHCGSELPRGAKFCNECGQQVTTEFSAPGAGLSWSAAPSHLAEKILTSRGALEGERKQVTVLFADVKGSMELLVDRDPEDARTLLDPVLERMIEAVHRYEGTVNQVMGDGIMALFGAPVAHEDHAVRACYAALRIQDEIKRYAAAVRRIEGVPIRIRVGLNSGDVVVRAIGSDLHMDYTAVGQTTHLAARMEQIADPGTVLVTPATLALAEGFVQVTPLGPTAMKGLPEPVEVYELTGATAVRSRLRAAAARGLTKFVGRAAELRHLDEALDVARSGRGQVVAVVGERGVGKSRLFWEFTHSHRTSGCLILETASVSYGKATAYFPLIELLKAYFDIQPRDDTRRIREKVTGKTLSLDRALEASLPAVLALLDAPSDDEQWRRLDPPQRRQRILDAVKRVLLRESEVQPLIVVVEDLHWIEQLAYHRGDYERAVELARGNIAAFRPEWHGDSFGTIVVVTLPVWDRLWLVNSLGHLGRFAEAADVETEMLRVADAALNPAAVASALLSSGGLQFARGDVAGALRALDRATSTARATGFGAMLPMVVGFLAWVLAESNATAEARDRLREGEELWRRATARRVMGFGAGATLLQWLASGHLAVGSVGDARRLATAGLEVAGAALGVKAALVCLLGAIAVRGGARDAADAESRFHDALALAEPRHMRPLIAHCHSGLAKVYRRTSKPDQERDHFTTAAAVYRELAMTYWLDKLETELKALA